MIIFASDILHHTAAIFGVSVEDLRGPRRFNELSTPRAVYAYLANEMTGLSMKSIGRTLGGRDHSSILHGIRKIRALVVRNGELQDAMNIIRDRSRSSAENRALDVMRKPETEAQPDRVFVLLEGQDGVWLDAEDARAMIDRAIKQKSEIYQETAARKTPPAEKAAKPSKPAKPLTLNDFDFKSEPKAQPERPIWELDEDEYLDRLAQIAMSKEDA